MRRRLAVLLLLMLAACAARPPKPTSYANAERVPINRPAAVQPAPTP